MAKITSSIGNSSITKTSQLINDGENSTSEYVEFIELGNVAISNDYNDLDNIPTTFTPSSHTHVVTDISGNKSQFNNSLTDGDFLFVGDVSNTPDATTTSKGVIKLAGDLAGTADAPTVPGLANKVDKVAGKSLIDNTEITRLATVVNQDISGKVDKVANQGLISDAEKLRLSTITNFDNSGNISSLSGKVDKVTGKSLIADAEIARLATLDNYTHPANHPPSIITQDVNNRFTTDAEKSTWNAKQNALGFTPYNSTNPAGYITSADIANKVDKVTGKSLISDTEIARLSTVVNQDISGKEDSFSKNTAFNKNFGVLANTVSEGNHLHSFSDLQNNPTTIAGYGITDANKSPINVNVTTVRTTAAKIGTTSSGTYTPSIGDRIDVTFTLGTAIANATLNIDGSGVKAIQLAGTNVTALSLSTPASLAVIPMYYNGTAWQIYGSTMSAYTNTTYIEATTGLAVTASTQVVAVNILYYANNASNVDFTLPATCAINSIVHIVGMNSTGTYRVIAPSGDNIIIENNDTGSSGILNGSVRSTLVLRCTVANTTWSVVNYTGLITSNTGYSTKTDVISYALSGPTGALVVGDVDTFHAPYNFTLASYWIGVKTPPTISSLLVDVKKNGTSITTTKAGIDATEFTSLTGTAPVITTTTFAKGDKIVPVISQIGSGDSGTSLKIYLEVIKT